MTIDDAAAILDVTEDHVKRLLRRGKLPGSYLVKHHRKHWITVDGRAVRKRRELLRRYR